MKEAYKRSDGRKIDGRRVVVDVERGRTVRKWKPRRFGGGLGGTRADKKKGDKSSGPSISGRTPSGGGGGSSSLLSSAPRSDTGHYGSGNPTPISRPPPSAGSDRYGPSGGGSDRDRDRERDRDRSRDRGDRGRDDKYGGGGGRDDKYGGGGDRDRDRGRDDRYGGGRDDRYGGGRDDRYGGGGDRMRRRSRSRSR